MTKGDPMPKTDPITLAIMRHALASAADQMALSLYRTACSTIVRDCLDFSTSLCDAQGQMIAQGVTLPHHIASVPFAMRTLLKIEKIRRGHQSRGRVHSQRSLRWRHAHTRHLRGPPRLLGRSSGGICGQQLLITQTWADGYPAALPATTPRSSRRDCESPGSSFTGEASRTRPSLRAAGRQRPDS